jgi:hypothetical protein
MDSNIIKLYVKLTSVLNYRTTPLKKYGGVELYLRTFLGAFAKLQKKKKNNKIKSDYSFVMSVCPSAWNNSAPTGWIVMNLIFEYFWKICLENSSFIKI